MNIEFLRNGGFALVLALSGLPATAQTVSQELVDRFRADGFTRIGVRNGLTQTKVEAFRGTEKVEVVVDRATGEVLKSETETTDSGRAGSGSVTVSTMDRDFVDDDDDDDRHGGRGEDDDDDDDDNGSQHGRGGDDDDDHDNDHGDDSPDHDSGDDHGDDGGHVDGEDDGDGDDD